MSKDRDNVTMNALIKLVNDEAKRVGILTWEGLSAIRQRCEITWKKESVTPRSTDREE